MRRFALRMPHALCCMDGACPFRCAACERVTFKVHDLVRLGYDGSRPGTEEDPVVSDHVLFSSSGHRPEIYVRILPEGTPFGRDISEGLRVIEIPERFLESHGGIPEDFEALPEDYPGFDAQGAVPGLYGFRWRQSSSELLGARNLLRFRLLSLSSAELREVNCREREQRTEDAFVVFFDSDRFRGDWLSAERLGFSLAREAGIYVRSCLICRNAAPRKGAPPGRPVICRVADGMSCVKYPLVTQAGLCGMYVEDTSVEDGVLDAFVDLVREIYRKG